MCFYILDPESRGWDYTDKRIKLKHKNLLSLEEKNHFSKPLLSPVSFVLLVLPDWVPTLDRVCAESPSAGLWD